MIPGKIRDVRTYDFQLHPQGVVPREELLTRAENLRRGTQTVTGVTTPDYRVNPPGQNFTPAPGTPGGPPIGSQPYYQLPPSSAPYPTPGPALPPGTIYSPPPGAAPVGPSGGGPILQPPPSVPAGPSNVGSQPYHALP